MLSPKKFLDKYDIILFDMDGVMTSEQAYWRCAALVVYEMLFSNKHYGTENTTDADLISRQEEIRKLVFAGDKTISALKNKGINSNWDLAYFVAGLSLALETKDFDEIYEYSCGLGNDIFAEYDALSDMLASKLGGNKEKYERGGEFWTEVQSIFQRLYLGDGSKNAIIYGEKPLHSIGKTETLLKSLIQSGKTLGIGTGRLRYEIEFPLTNWGLFELFDKDRIITYDNIIDDEKMLAEKGIFTTLTKPHPYMFLKGALSSEFSTEKIISGDYDKDTLKKVLVVGDAGADLYAAKNAGIDFLAVLTGVSGQAARSFFEGQADYILDSILDMAE